MFSHKNIENKAQNASQKYFKKSAHAGCELQKQESHRGFRGGVSAP
jgi:hypothetical protein